MILKHHRHECRKSLIKFMLYCFCRAGQEKKRIIVWKKPRSHSCTPGKSYVSYSRKTWSCLVARSYCWFSCDANASSPKFTLFISLKRKKEQFSLLNLFFLRFCLNFEYSGWQMWIYQNAGFTKPFFLFSCSELVIIHLPQSQWPRPF